MKTFEPILKDQPIQFAFDHKDIFENKPRSKAWGGDVFFFPPTISINDYGCGGYHYQQGYTYNVNRGYKGNCTYWCGCRYLQVSSITLKEVIGSAWKTFDKYNGRKDGGEFNGEYIGDTIQKGDMITFADNLNKTGDGHIIFVEDVDGDILHISESAYSQKDIYEGKACIVYDLNKNDLITGKRVTLRPKLPYSEYVYGVIHTGDVFDKKDNKKEINKLAKQIVDLSK